MPYDIGVIRAILRDLKNARKEHDERLSEIEMIVAALYDDEVEKCVHYNYDLGAFEHNCDARDFKDSDFNPLENCFACRLRRVREAV